MSTDDLLLEDRFAQILLLGDDTDRHTLTIGEGNMRKLKRKRWTGSCESHPPLELRYVAQHGIGAQSGSGFAEICQPKISQRVPIPNRFARGIHSEDVHVDTVQVREEAVAPDLIQSGLN